MAELQAICVLCGSRPGSNPVYERDAIRLGQMIAERGVRLVYGGGSIGLMGVIANSTLAAGGEVVGVIPDFLMRYEVGHMRLTDLVITGSMHDRKRRMFEMADGFVVLPGGLGTLDETFEVLTWKQIRLHDEPIVVLDSGGYWAPLQKMIEAVVDSGFAHAGIADLFTIVSRPEDVFTALSAAPQPKEEVLTSHF